MNWFKSFWKALTSSKPRIEIESFEPSGIYTPRAEQVFALARKEAVRLNHSFVGTEHLLLGIIRLGEGVAVGALEKIGLGLEGLRQETLREIGTGPPRSPASTQRAKKVLVLAKREAQALNHSYVGTEHILLGLLREGDGVAGQVLKNLGMETDAVRNSIVELLSPDSSASGVKTPDPPNSQGPKGLNPPG